MMDIDPKDKNSVQEIFGKLLGSKDVGELFSCTYIFIINRFCCCNYYHCQDYYNIVIIITIITAFDTIDVIRSDD